MNLRIYKFVSTTYFSVTSLCSFFFVLILSFIRFINLVLWRTSVVRDFCKKIYQKKFHCKSHDRESHCVITSSSKDIKELRYSPLNSLRTMCDFINYDTDYMCVWEHVKEIIVFGVICTSSLIKKWKSFIFILYHSAS